MKLDYPKVSVVISTFDRPKMLREAIASVLAQDFRDWELIVVDDCSDTAKAVAREFMAEGRFQGHRVRVLSTDAPSGYQCVPKNVGVLHSRGSYVAYLDDDNLWDTDHLATCVDTIERLGTDAVYSRWRYTGDGPFTDKEFPHVPMTREVAQKLIQGPANNIVDSSSLLHSRASVLGCLGNRMWSPRVRRFGDWDLVARMLNEGLTFAPTGKVTFTYRWHGQNLQLTRAAKQSDVTLQRWSPEMVAP